MMIDAGNAGRSSLVPKMDVRGTTLLNKREKAPEGLNKLGAHTECTANDDDRLCNNNSERS